MTKESYFIWFYMKTVNHLLIEWYQDVGDESVLKLEGQDKTLERFVLGKYEIPYGISWSFWQRDLQEYHK